MQSINSPKKATETRIEVKADPKQKQARVGTNKKVLAEEKKVQMPK